MSPRLHNRFDTVHGMSHERFIEAAQRVLGGDDSIRAANALEAVVLDDYLSYERFDELGEVLALYAPGQGRSYSGVEELRQVIRRTFASIREC